MKCPNCEREIYRNMCPHCGVDAIVFSKTSNASNVLYNKSLQKIKVNDLSGAIECLEKSVEFNKQNTDARNLLGLIYFEIGEVGEALKQWVISVARDKRNNLAEGYINTVQKNARQLEKQNDAIKIYNQALIYVHQKSEDLAIIQLKKALELNNKLLSAMNLLAFCYLIQKEKEKARVLLDRVLAIDTNNIIALNYYAEMGAARQRAESFSVRQNTAMRPVVSVPQVTSSYTGLSTKSKKSFGETFHISELLFFIIGGVCAFALFYILWMPQAVGTRDETIERLKGEITAAAQDAENTKNNYDTQISSLQEENTTLKKEKNEMNERIDLQERIQKTNDIINLFTTTNAEETADQIYSLDTTGFPADVLESLIATKAEAYKAAASNLYDQAALDFNAKQYAEAKLKFGKAIRYADPLASYTDDIIYLLGRIAEYDSDPQEAIRCYESVVNNYPNSNRFAEATASLNRLSP